MQRLLLKMPFRFMTVTPREIYEKQHTNKSYSCASVNLLVSECEGSDCPPSGSGRGTALRQFRATSASDPEKGLVEKYPWTASLSQSDPIGG